MGSINIVQIPAYILLTGRDENTWPRASVLRTVSKIVKKKLYKRTSNRSFSGSFNSGRAGSKKRYSPSRKRRSKWKLFSTKEIAKSAPQHISNKRHSRKSITDTDSSSSALSSVASTSTRPVSWTSRSRVARQLFTPESGMHSSHLGLDQDVDFVDADDYRDEILVTPSPIRDSPSYQRQSRRSNIPPGESVIGLPISYPELPVESRVSFSQYHTGIKDANAIDRDLFKKLAMPTTGKLNSELGTVYTACLKDVSGYVKIGFTTTSVEDRMSYLSVPEEGIIVYSENDPSPGGKKWFTNSQRAEQIIHAELCDLRRRLQITRSEKSPGGETEWFEISVQEAHKVIRKWRDWFTVHEPYDEKGALKLFWDKRLQDIRKRDQYDSDTHGNLHERWCRVLNPSQWDMVRYYTCTWTSHHLHRFWIPNRVIGCLTICMIVYMKYDVIGILILFVGGLMACFAQ